MQLLFLLQVNPTSKNSLKTDAKITRNNVYDVDKPLFNWTCS